MALGQAVPLACSPPDTGVGAGGRMRQEVHVGDRPLVDYDESGARRVFAHLCSAAQ